MSIDRDLTLSIWCASAIFSNSLRSLVNNIAYGIANNIANNGTNSKSIVSGHIQCS